MNPPIRTHIHTYTLIQFKKLFWLSPRYIILHEVHYTYSVPCHKWRWNFISKNGHLATFKVMQNANVKLFINCSLSNIQLRPSPTFVFSYHLLISSHFGSIYPCNIHHIHVHFSIYKHHQGSSHIMLL